MARRGMDTTLRDKVSQFESAYKSGYNSGYNAAIEDAARKLDEYEPPTWCAKCEARTHECGCEPDARTRFMQHVSEAVRGLLR